MDLRRFGEIVTEEGVIIGTISDFEISNKEIKLY